MSWGRSAHCTWDIRMEAGHMTGEMWIDGDKWKQDITTEGRLMHLIGDGEYMYMWGPAGPEMDIEYNYDCEPMSTPSSMFVPPRGIDFMDVREMVAGMGR